MKLIAFFVLLLVPSGAFAAPLFVNQLSPTPSGSSEFTAGCCNVYTAENFTLTAASIVQEIAFTALHDTLPNNNPTSMDWRILAFNAVNPSIPGTIIASGTHEPFTTRFIRFLAPYPISEFVVDVPDLMLGAGDYWVAFHVNARVDNTYWATASAGDGLSATTAGGLGWRNPAPGIDRAFRIEGVTATTPEPATLLLLGIGFGAAAMRTIRRRVQVPQDNRG